MGNSLNMLCQDITLADEMVSNSKEILAYCALIQVKSIGLLLTSYCQSKMSTSITDCGNGNFSLHLADVDTHGHA